MKNIILLLFTFLSFSTFSQEKDAEYYSNFVRDSLWNNTISSERDYRLMIEYLNVAIKLDSNKAKYYNNRGLANFLSYNNTKALKDYRLALSIDSTSIKYASIAHYYRAKAFGKIGRHSDAINSINKAIEIDSLDLEYLNVKAQLLSTSGKYLESIKIYEKLKSISNPDLHNRWDEAIFNIEELQKTQDFRRVGFYYPGTWLSQNDSLNYPIKIGIEFNLFTLKLDEIKKNLFQAEFNTVMYTKYPPRFIRSNDLNNYMYNDTVVVADLNENLYIKSVESEDFPVYFGRSNFVDSSKYTYGFLKPIKKTFDHNWDLSDFPFDKQNFLIKISTTMDSSVYSFEKYQTLGFKNHFNDVNGLPSGMNVEEVNYYNEYVKMDIIEDFSPTVSRKVISPVAVYEIVVSRSGSLLFVKLFLGTFLAFIMSLSAFTISKRNFPSRIDVSVGALFIAVGNKYFVESTTPMVQILTKADIINNLSLLLIIMNVVFIISQHRKDINIGKFEDSKYTLKFSAALLAALVFITIIF